MYLTSFSIIEPDEKYYLYYPGWLNVWEAHLYKTALKATAAQGWGFKRFGVRDDIYIREAIRKPACKNYTDAMEQVAENALQGLSTKERMRLMRARTAFIYADSWGDTGSFEHLPSSLQLMAIDMLPKNLVRKFAVNDFTCKIRGERQAFMQALSMAQDYLHWQVFDYVVICCAWRAIPALVLSDAQSTKRPARPDGRINLSVERVGCFIFGRSESGMRVASGRYVIPDGEGQEVGHNPLHGDGVDLFTLADAGAAAVEERSVNLVDIYGGSGCLTPALGWAYLGQSGLTGGKMRTLVSDIGGGYNYFDTWY